MFINVITPCSRPQNLTEISKSIIKAIPEGKYRWIVVVDTGWPVNKVKSWWMIPDNADIYTLHDPGSRWGNAQRNYAIDRVNGGYLYFLDDDTIMHPELYQSLHSLSNDFIHFNQVNTDGTRRIGGTVQFKYVDSGNVLIDSNLVGKTRWILNRYGADGLFICEVFSRCANPVYIDKSLSIYNYLRK